MSILAKTKTDRNFDLALYKENSQCWQEYGFSELPFWPWQDSDQRISQQQAEFHSLVNGSRVITANQYADIVSAYAQDLSKKSENRNETLYVLDLNAHSAYFAFKFLSKLEEILSADLNIHIVYLLSESRVKIEDDSAEYSKLEPYIGSGRLDFAENMSDDGNAVETFLLKYNKKALKFASIKIPPVVIAVNYFNCLKQDLYYIYYDNIYTANFSEVDGNSNEGNLERVTVLQKKFDIDWRPLSFCYSGIYKVLEYYANRLDCSAILFPEGALCYIKQLEENIQAGFLLLSQDYAISHANEVGLQTALTLIPEDGVLLPFNSHALQVYSFLNGDTFFKLDGQPGSVSSSAMLIGRQAEEFPGTVSLLKSAPQNFTHVDLFNLRLTILNESVHLSSGQILTYLRISEWDCGLLDTLMPYIPEVINTLSPIERFDWIEALHELFQGYFPESMQPDYAFDIGFIATHLNAWSLAVKAYRESLRCCGNEVICLGNLGYCYWQLGETDLAETFLGLAVQSGRANNRTKALLDEILNWKNYCSNLNWYFPELHSDEVMVLQPIGLQHAEAFFYQYRDPAIADLVRLPDFADVAAVASWIELQQKKGNPLYAVIHRKFGFIGCVALSLSEDAAFFYFWIGADYQNQGFGRRAAKLLLELAEVKLGCRYIFTSTYICNRRSQKALMELGFITLPFQAKEPDADMKFWLYKGKTLPADVGSLNANYESCFSKLKHLLYTCESSISLTEARNIDCD